MYDKEKQFAGKLKRGAQKAGRTAEHDYERYNCFHSCCASQVMIESKGLVGITVDLLEQNESGKSNSESRLVSTLRSVVQMLAPRVAVGHSSRRSEGLHHTR